MKSRKRYKIIIIESSEIIATGLQELIKTEYEFEIAGTFTDCRQAATQIHKLQPDLIILNPQVIDFKQKQCQETFFGNNAHIPLVALVWQYITPENLKSYRTTIDITDEREKIIKKLLQVVEIPSSKNPGSENNELSEREKEILISVAQGMINKEIAEKHHISIHTVITHRKNITRKTGIKSVAGLTVFALLNNLIHMDEVE